jgi:hypothetical protein
LVGEIFPGVLKEQGAIDAPSHAPIPSSLAGAAIQVEKLVDNLLAVICSEFELSLAFVRVPDHLVSFGAEGLKDIYNLVDGSLEALSYELRRRPTTEVQLPNALRRHDFLTSS